MTRVRDRLEELYKECEDLCKQVGWVGPKTGQPNFRLIYTRSLSNNSFLETKTATQYPAYSNRDFVVELLTSLHSPNYAYRLEYCLSDRLLALNPLNTATSSLLLD